MKTALVLGAGGFIGSHMVNRLKEEGYWVMGLDIKEPEFSKSKADAFYIADLRDRSYTRAICEGHKFDLVIQLAALMGGCQYIFTGGNDADIMSNNTQINLNVCEIFKNTKTKIFFSSSACMYPQNLQDSDGSIALEESMGEYLDPDSMYGLEKGFSERLYESYHKNYGLDIRIARFHNIYGTETTFKGGKEKAPASVSRKVFEATDKVQVWGTGDQKRSFLYIDDCIDAVMLLLQSDYTKPINIGSEESVTINQLWEYAIEASGKKLFIEHVDRPPNTLGVYNRNSDNRLIRKVLNWEPKYSLKEGIKLTYDWIKSQYGDIT